MESKRLEHIIFSAIFLGLFILTFFVFKPFLSIIVLAAILSILFYPLYGKLLEMFRGGKSFAACLVVVVALFFLIMPILFLGLQILGQAQNFFSLTQIGQGQYIGAVQSNLDKLTGHFISGFSINISDFINKALVFISDNLGIMLSQTASIFFQIFLLIFAFFFFLRDGKAMLDSFVSLSPFEKEQDKKIFDSIHRTITSVIRGTLFVGLIRFALIAGAFYFFGVPNALLWATVGGIIGAVPGLGTALVIIPTFLFFLLYGNIFSAIGIGLFGIFLVFFIDNLLSAYFFGKGLKVPSIFILLSILGGIVLFGPLGFIFGPIILSLFISAIDMYKILVLKKV